MKPSVPVYLWLLVQVKTWTKWTKGDSLGQDSMPTVSWPGVCVPRGMSLQQVQFYNTLPKQCPERKDAIHFKNKEMANQQQEEMP